MQAPAYLIASIICAVKHIAVFDTFPLLLNRLAKLPHFMDLFASPQFATTSLHFIIWQDVRNLDTSHRRSLIGIRICICILGISFDIHHSRYRHISFVYIPLISISSYHLFGHTPRRIYLEGIEWEAKNN